ncbi:uncharacterized protein B0T23DRAFT_432978 [Neurospora hispaniola]|uniref:Uncharacterized protein n=1 Tax=Neurospora hispaniola TaxID=588809 RepID=A0AAJ0MLX5_9PEZI|nr:hypothetical protein B0T23DRAFT_432978 [Neurospora hispaniola]
MARTEYITRSTTAQKLQTPRRSAEPVVVDEEEKQPKLSTAPDVDDESELLIPEPVSTASSKPADEAASMTTTHSTPEKPTTIKKIILHLPPPPVLTALQILPVDTIISDMTAANGGIPPCSAEILVEAIKWFKHAYRTALSPRVVRSAAEQILEQLDTVMSGNPAYRHNIPRGMAYERLEVQRKFLRAIIHIHCGMLNDLEVFDMIVARD